jgi:hypothetical protein
MLVFGTIGMEVTHFLRISLFSYSIINFFWIVLSCFSLFPLILFFSLPSPHLLLLFDISSFLTFQVFFLIFSTPLPLLILLCSHILQHILLILLSSPTFFLFFSSLFVFFLLIASCSPLFLLHHSFHILLILVSFSSLQKSYPESSSTFIILILSFLISTYFPLQFI